MRFDMKIEMHTHTKESSPCAHIDAAQMVRMYTNEGYDAVVITDHYNKWSMEQMGAVSSDEYSDYVLSGFYAAKKAASDNLIILPGIEVTLLESPNDYLLYGIKPDFLYNNPYLYKLTLRELYSLCHKNDILLVQAHPCRAYCSPAPFELLDGIEVYNGNPRHNSNNDKTYNMAVNSDLILTSGSDFHQTEDLAHGGIITNSEIYDIKDLTNVLKSSDYSLIRDGECQ